MAQWNKTCANCGQLGHSKFYCPSKRNKPIKQVGKQTLKYNAWRDKIARPYVIERDGYLCYDCRVAFAVDLHHKRGRLYDKYNLDELVYLCRKCHQKRHKII